MAAVLALPLAAYAYVGTATRWMADSYCYANIGQLWPLWTVLRHWHTQWTGRFGFNLLESLAGRAGPGLAPWLPPLYLLAWLGAAAWLARGLLPARAGRWAAWGTGALALGVTLVVIPEINQSLYWTSGLQNYVPPLILATVMAGVLVRRVGVIGASTDKRMLMATVAAPVACLGLGFAAGGFSEMFTGMQAALLAGLTVLAILAGPRAQRTALPCLAAALAGGAGAAWLEVTAPGNAIRALQLPPPTAWEAVPRIALRFAALFVAEGFARAPIGVAGAAALAGCAGYWLGDGGGPERRRSLARLMAWLPLAAGGAILIGYAIAARTFGGPPPGRGLVVPAYGLAWALLAWSYAAGGWLRAAGVGQSQDREMRLWGWGARVLAAGALASAAWAAVQTVPTRAAYAAYAAAWDKRHVDLEAARALGAARVAVAPIVSVSNLEEAGADPRRWLNGCIGDYHGLEMVTAPPAPPPDAAALASMIPLDAQLGNVARVEGYSLEGDPARAGESVRVTVFWRPLAASERPLTVFVHLYDAGSGSVAQYDGQPLGGAYPTTSWVFGSLFAETYTLTTPTDLAAGAQPAAVVGLYDVVTLEREAATGEDGDGSLNWVTLKAK